MPDTIRLDNVPGSCIAFRNFRGKPTPVTKGGDRSFCLIIPNRLVRDQLTARGCNIKKLKNKAIIDGEKLNDIEFVNVAVRITPEENMDGVWGALDIDKINKADLEFSFYEYNINGMKGTKIYLKNARFCVKDLFEQTIIDIRWPNTISVTNSTNNTNNAEETNMEKMTRAEVMGQLQLGITAFEMNGDVKKDPVVSRLMCAMRNAIEYIGEVPKSETKVKTVTIEKKVPTLPGIKQVIFNHPATIIIWDDDVKTVVECQKGDSYNLESGLAMAICKRFFGNKSNFNKQIRKYTEDAKNVQTKKKAKEGTFAERKAERMAQAEANKTAKGKSKASKKKALDKARNNDKTMVVLTEAYRTKLRIKMAEKGWTYAQLAEKAGLGKSTVTRLISTAKQKFMPTKIRREVFNKLNTALGIRWKS